LKEWKKYYESDNNRQELIELEGIGMMEGNSQELRLFEDDK
jgi:hypothetical protein